MKDTSGFSTEELEHLRGRRSSEVLNSETYRRELLGRILRSAPLARSERLGALLTYICETSFKGNADKLNEQRIGRFVFGRAEDYDSSVDGIVRSQASRLRQRLDQYFSEEGLAEPLRISIPRGTYVPLFSEREVLQEHDQTTSANTGLEAVPAQAATPHVTASAVDTNYVKIFPWLLVALLSVVVLATWFHSYRPETEVSASVKTENPTLLRFWAGVFARDTSTLLVTPDSGLVMYENFSGTQVDLKSYLDGRYRAGVEQGQQAKAPMVQPATLLDLANRRYTSIVDVEAILDMRERALATKGDVQVRFARDLRPNDLKHGNVVLLGASSADPWVELFEKDMNFVLQDFYMGDRAVQNRHPSGSEPERWTFPHGNPNREVFGIVAFRPNLAGDGNALILEGTSMSGTEAATDFIMDASQFVPFLQQIGATSKYTPHFEVVLTTTNLGASAGRPKILAWRQRP